MEESSQIPEPESMSEGQERLEHVLPPKKYKLKIMLLFTDFFAILIYVYYLMIRSIVKDVSNGSVSFVSNRMFAFYCVLAITVAILVLLLVFKLTRSVRTRFERDNEVRQNPNIKVWLTGYDWGWPILFLPTMALMIGAGIVGMVLNLLFDGSTAVLAAQDIFGGIVVAAGALNAAVIIFKLKPVTLGLLLGGFLIVLLILLLHGPNTFLGFFKGFRHLGVKIEPLGYILLAYVWSVFLMIIWVKSLFL